MQKIADRLLFSPSDLNHFLECEHLIQLERARDPDAVRPPRDAHADLLAEKGAEHERAWLDRFRGEGRDVAVIDAAGRDWDRKAAQTIAAMRAGAGVIYQGVFADGDWRGVSDFLVRMEKPSALGGWSYEAWDLRRKRHGHTTRGVPVSPDVAIRTAGGRWTCSISRSRSDLTCCARTAST